MMTTVLPKKAAMLGNKPSTAFILCLLLLAFPLLVQAATLTSVVNRTTIPLNETFSLHVTYDDDPDDQEIDTALLQQQFKIASSNKTSSIQIINGKASRKTTWYFELAARKTGTLLIPSFSINNNFSEAITITVTDVPKSVVNTNQRIYSEVSIDKNQVHVQEQLIVTWRLVSSLAISDPAMEEPKIDNVLVHDLGSRQYQRSSADGRVEMVIEQRYAFFPQQSGSMVIPAQQFQFVVNTTRRFHTGLLHNAQEKRLIRTDAQSINVLPAETGTTVTAMHSHWLPALDVDVAQELVGLGHQGAATAGEAFTRVITIRTLGLMAEQLPATVLDVPGFKTYSEKPEFNNESNDKGVYGSRTERVTMIPTTEGTLTLPAIQIPWYNTSSGQWETTRLAAREIVVLPGKHAQGGTATNNMSTNNTNTNNTSTNNTDTTASNAANTPAQGTGNASALLIEGFSPLVTGVIAVLALALLLVLVKLAIMQKQMNALLTTGKLPTITTTTTASTKATATALLQTAAASDADTFYKAVLQWGRQQWADNPPHSLAEVAARIGDPALGQQLLALDAFLYGGQPTLPALTDISTGLQQYSTAAEKPATTGRQQLEELYGN